MFLDLFYPLLSMNQGICFTVAQRFLIAIASSPREMNFHAPASEYDEKNEG
jgi:hypothetical protein